MDESGLLYQYIRLDTNKGISYAKNTALDHATGDYVIFHDQDDWMESNCLEMLYSKAIATNADRVVGEYREVAVSGSTLRVVSYGDGFSKWLYTGLHAVLYRKEVIDQHNIRMSAGTLMEDADFNCQFSLYSEKETMLHEIVFNYLIRDDSRSGAKNNTESWNAITLFDSALASFSNIASRIQDEEDAKAYIEYSATKQLYYYLLHNNRYSESREVYGQYCQMRENLQSCFPDYLNNPLMKWPLFGFRRNGDRLSGQRRTALLSGLEKLGKNSRDLPMRCFLKLFLVISKKKYLT